MHCHPTYVRFGRSDFASLAIVARTTRGALGHFHRHSRSLTRTQAVTDRIESVILTASIVALTS
jgi:hypothetical protein